MKTSRKRHFESSATIQRNKGLFIAIEGIHGAGKSTQVKAVACWLTEHGYDVTVTREVGGTALAERIRGLIQMQGEATKTANRKAMLFLVMAARASHMTQVIRPSLNAGKIVITDRFEASTYVYQHSCDHLGEKLISKVNEYVTGGVSPDLTILLDLPVEEALGRKVNSWFGQAPREIFQHRLFDYHQRARQAYLELASTKSSAKHHWAVIDCENKGLDEVTEEILSVVRPRLSQGTLKNTQGLYQLQLALNEV